tara:strand:+ start:433 stop:594 length:162 start_codon:yes stop_codon:yes gene_type:complete
MVLGSPPASNSVWKLALSAQSGEMPMFGAGADPKTTEKLRKNVKTDYFFNFGY